CLAALEELNGEQSSLDGLRKLIAKESPSCSVEEPFEPFSSAEILKFAEDRGVDRHIASAMQPSALSLLLRKLDETPNRDLVNAGESSGNPDRMARFKGKGFDKLLKIAR